MDGALGETRPVEYVKSVVLTLKSNNPAVKIVQK